MITCSSSNEKKLDVLFEHSNMFLFSSQCCTSQACMYNSTIAISSLERD